MVVVLVFRQARQPSKDQLDFKLLFTCAGLDMLDISTSSITATRHDLWVGMRGKWRRSRHFPLIPTRSDGATRWSSLSRPDRGVRDRQRVVTLGLRLFVY
jgi:hypothetical protein